jgi:hypothetical protein
LRRRATALSRFQHACNPLATRSRRACDATCLRHGSNATCLRHGCNATCLRHGCNAANAFQLLRPPPNGGRARCPVAHA